MKIDIVYTWVDGSDPEWNAKRNEKLLLAGRLPKNVNSEALFQDNHELRYSLRSIAKYIPWINKIFIVTDNQIPVWLNTSHPKIKIIDHKDIFSNKDYLPTFNSCSIETQLHHISELSEQFIYFNDDMFVGRDCTPDIFFDKQGKPRIFTAEILPIPKKKFFDITQRDPLKINIHQHQIVTTRRLLRDKFGKPVYSNIRHGAKPLLKSKLYELEEIFKEELALTVGNSFRSPEDIIFIYLFEYWAILNKIGKPKYLKSINLDKQTSNPSKLFSKYKFGFINLHDEKLNERLNNLRNAMPTLFCLNQTPDTPQENIELLMKFFNDYFPEKCEFEI
jgi:hypothetical protein